MAFVTLEDFTGKGDGIVFSDAFQKFGAFLFNDSMIMAIGKGEPSGDLLKILVNDVLPLDRVRERYTKSIAISLNLDQVDEGTVIELRKVMERNRGTCVCYIDVVGGGLEKKLVYLSRKLMVDPNTRLIGSLKQLLGPSAVRLQG